MNPAGAPSGVTAPPKTPPHPPPRKPLPRPPAREAHGPAAVGPAQPPTDERSSLVEPARSPAARGTGSVVDGGGCADKAGPLLAATELVPASFAGRHDVLGGGVARSDVSVAAEPCATVPGARRAAVAANPAGARAWESASAASSTGTAPRPSRPRRARRNAVTIAGPKGAAAGALSAARSAMRELCDPDA